MIIFINYDEKEKVFIMSCLIKSNDGIIPLKREIIYLDNYPYLVKELMEKKTIYIDSFDGYLGLIKTEGPYCEQEVFNSIFECHNSEFNELLLGLDKNVKDGKLNVKKLIKIGNSYKPINNND